MKRCMLRKEISQPGLITKLISVCMFHLLGFHMVSTANYFYAEAKPMQLLIHFRSGVEKNLSVVKER